MSDKDEFSPADTAAEQLRRWDAGKTIWSIEMGGFGPGYEQAIQLLAIEIVRDNLGKPLPSQRHDLSRGWGDDTAKRIDKQQPDGSFSCGGFSGAQFGAARWLAYQWLAVGPAAVLEAHESSRHIQVSSFWPRVAA